MGLPWAATERLRPVNPQEGSALIFPDTLILCVCATLTGTLGAPEEGFQLLLPPLTENCPGQASETSTTSRLSQALPLPGDPHPPPPGLAHLPLSALSATAQPLPRAPGLFRLICPVCHAAEHGVSQSTNYRAPACKPRTLPVRSAQLLPPEAFWNLPKTKGGRKEGSATLWTQKRSQSRRLPALCSATSTPATRGAREAGISIAPFAGGETEARMGPNSPNSRPSAHFPTHCLHTPGPQPLGRVLQGTPFPTSNRVQHKGALAGGGAWRRGEARTSSLSATDGSSPS